MRSEDGAGGPGVAVATRGPSGREKPSSAESQFRRESPRREAEAPLAASSSCGSGAGKPREEKRTVLSKVVIRRLPPSLTKEQLEQQLHPLPAHDYFDLYPHLYSRAYINFRNPDDILLFRDRFDGYIFIDSKGLEYPAVVEFAPFQKIAKKKLKKKDAKTGSIEDDPEYKKFLETYCVEEEKTSASPETLLGDIEAKTRELIARRTTPLLEYIKNRKLEKQRIREEKREERRRRELEKKRLREEEKRRRREEEKCRRKAAEKQKKTVAEKEVRMKLLKKPEKGEEPSTEKPKERAEEIDPGDGRWEPCPSGTVLKPKPSEGSLEELWERKHRAHCELEKCAGRSGEELAWGKGLAVDRGRKGSQDGGCPAEAAERLGREKSEDRPAPRKERTGNKDRPGLQLYQPRSRIQARDCDGRHPEEGRDGRRGEVEDSTVALAEKSEEVVWGDMHVGDVGRGSPPQHSVDLRGRSFRKCIN
ncbi:hypothetical protein Celaphus_00016864 [Cervus elaphus hippelaphus]|uniref:UPF3 domain-containing protein n=1 Tax=Cervus elaphus hippelaphus TaxID=46360 RepID=A0A212C4K2_CEREH|nr:hypothetical protein Celaphus_00016864 [Cervus elaphus hippelaphus]